MQAAIGPMSIPALLIASGIASLDDPPAGQEYVNLVMAITFLCGAMSEKWCVAAAFHTIPHLSVISVHPRCPKYGFHCAFCISSGTLWVYFGISCPNDRKRSQGV